MTPDDLPPKPPYRAPCNGCGFCCAMVICDVGRIAFPDEPAPCPALVLSHGRAWCGLVIFEGAERQISDLLGIGCGCDCDADPGVTWTAP